MIAILTRARAHTPLLRSVIIFALSVSALAETLMGSRGGIISIFWPSMVEASQTIYIGNLAHSVTQSDIELLVASFGDIDEIRLFNRVKDPAAFAFVQFGDYASAMEAIRVLHGTSLPGLVTEKQSGLQVCLTRTAACYRSGALFAPSSRKTGSHCCQYCRRGSGVCPADQTD
jgi:hypothetical protein